MRNTAARRSRSPPRRRAQPEACRRTEHSPPPPQVLATGGDTRLGGEDFDLAIVEHLLKLILKDSGKKLKDDARAFKRLKVAAQKAKEDLSNANSASIVLDKLWDGDGGNFEYELTKDQFNKLIEPYSKM